MRDKRRLAGLSALPLLWAPALSAEPGALPASDAPVEITVVGKRRGPADSTQTSSEIRELPGAFGDPFRALDAMPGVTPVASGVPYYMVRGIPPGNVGYFLDGVRVPLLFHVFFGPAVIHPGLIGTVELVRGAYPARYGRYAGAIVSADLASPQRELGGEASVRLADAGALVEAPFAEGRGTAIVAGRYSYTGAIVTRFSDVTLSYWDYQALASYDLGKGHSLGIFAFGARDEFSQDENAFASNGSVFHRVDLRWDHRSPQGARRRLALTYGHDRTQASGGFVSDRSLAGRAHVEEPLSSDATFHGGFDFAHDRYDLEVGLFDAGYTTISTLFPARDELAAGAFLELVVRPDPVVLTAGLRADLWRSLGETEVGLDPRLTARFDLGSGLHSVHSVGIAHQAPNFVPGVPGASLAGLRGGLQRSIQASSGVEAELPGGFSGSATLFDTVVIGLSDPLGTTRDASAEIETAYERSLGSTVGLELLLKRPLSRRLGALISYTLSRSERSRDRISSVSALDRTHVLNAAVSYDLGNDWRAGGRLLFMSGVPAEHETRYGRVYDGGDRTRPFYRLDVKLQKHWMLGERARIGVVLEALNATFNHEVIRRECTAVQCTDTEVGPVMIPNLGVEAAF